MAKIKPFRGLRPDEKSVALVAALPYDVYSREEAKGVVKNNSLSFLGIDRAETQFDDSVDTYAPEVYKKADEMIREWTEKGIFVREAQECFYVYSLTMDGRRQTGLVACSSVEDYVNEVIKKHENTRADKELDRIHHVDTTSAQTGPIFLAYRDDERVNAIIKDVMGTKALYDFTSEDGIRHEVWKIQDPESIKALVEEFETIPNTYIADGHHRAASAVKVALKRREEHPEYTGNEEFNYFLSVLFPESELKIFDYNRVVFDLNGLSKEAFLEKISEKFDVKEEGKKGTPYRPEEKASFGMYLDGQWYALKAHKEILSEDPVEGLDVSLLQNHLLEPVLGIQNPKTDQRIDFIGGIRGLSELERRVEKVQDTLAVAFSMYPTSMGELFAVADANLLMPPKSTWFEPKLRSGIFIHEFER